ncbi:MAG: hypothetical protein EOP11_27025 [Proteobacteria bacterium]|nr:MAG: hypothetical protein EOP11_27025 [Pseudomonadota bacterium]
MRFSEGFVDLGLRLRVIRRGRAHGAEPGLYSKRGGSTSVGLDPRCGGLSVSVVIHEFYHVIGHENGQSLHNSYKKPFNAHPGCPVSSYGATNFYEDFAEAGRLYSVPDNDRNNTACAGSKVSELGSIVQSCR